MSGYEIATFDTQAPPVRLRVVFAPGCLGLYVPALTSRVLSRGLSKVVQRPDTQPGQFLPFGPWPGWALGCRFWHGARPVFILGAPSIFFWVWVTHLWGWLACFGCWGLVGHCFVYKSVAGGPRTMAATMQSGRPGRSKLVFF